MTAFLLDANVLVALTIAEHEHHARASEWLSGVDEFAVCPITEGALVRFLLRMGESIETASSVLRGVRSSPKCLFWQDTLSYLDLDSSTIQGHRQVTDTYLAGLAVTYDGLLATLDEALARRHPDECLLVPDF